ncbi:mannitol 1-phosphate dehydrogenase [Coniella lustricola]|uniref:Mannitol 1-phosphate dehydrogenase n=1 Tax=Coniella lustricola TaxID=2025994 RepID=A0A2T2ZVK4_9PEZI|nr:mannitol 1-phosphate dehydrogenase [Coniella lustricola]
MSSSSAPADIPSIAIVGGGIAGLTLALNLVNLAKATPSPNFSVVVYEAAHAFGEIGAGVSFGPNASHAMKSIGPEVYEAFERTETTNQYASKSDVWFDFHFGESIDGKYKVEGEAGTGPEDSVGELVATVHCKNGQRGVKRSDFLDQLIKHVPEGVARFGRRVVDYTTTPAGHVELHFKDGSKVTHDAVIGCDGIKSSIRKVLLADTAKPEAANAVFSGKYCYRGLIPMEEAVAAIGDETAKNAQMFLGRHRHILTFPIEGGKILNVVVMCSAKEWTDDKWVVQADHDTLKAEFVGWSSTVTKMIDLMRQNDIWALFHHLPATTYVSPEGRVVLTGDAAHATTPHKGSGAGMAIEDSYILGHLIAEAFKLAPSADKAIPAAFRMFDEVRRPRTQRLVEDSCETGTVYQMEHPVFGDDKEKLRETLETRMAWVWEHDVVEELADAVEKLKATMA